MPDFSGTIIVISFARSIAYFTHYIQQIPIDFYCAHAEYT